MKDFKALIDSQMSKIQDEHDKNPERENDPEVDPFYKALLDNDMFKNGICNTMETVAQKFAAAMMSQPKSAEELKDMLTTKAFCRPLLTLAYMGYLFGKADTEAADMEKMFGKMELDMKEAK